MNTKKLLNSYYNWLKDNTVTKHDHETGWSLISTPFTCMFNDMIEVYMKVDGDRILFSDDGVTVNNLETIGINISKSPSRRRVFDSILLNFGVKFNELELQAECLSKEFPKRKHLFLEALIGVNDMFMLSKENVARRSPLAARPSVNHKCPAPKVRMTTGVKYGGQPDIGNE